MAKYIAIFLSIFLSLSAFAQKKMTRKEYIETYAELAVKEMKRTGIPASITLAQGCLESSDGNSALSLEGNNHFGIKCHSSWSGKKMHMDDDAKGECFRVYESAYDSYIDHSNFLLKGQRYAFLFDLDPTDYKGWAKGLKKAGYATNPKYAEMLIKIIEEYELYKYDEPEKNQIAFANDNSEKPQRTFALGFKKAPLKDAPDPTVAPPDPKGEQPTDNKFNKDIYENNHTDFVIVQDGETVFMLSTKFGIPVWKLFYFNDFKAGHRVKDGDIVYLEAKQNKAQKPYQTHKITKGETLQTISQLYGVKVEKLAKLNRMSVSQELEEGANIYVRKNMVKFE